MIIVTKIVIKTKDNNENNANWDKNNISNNSNNNNISNNEEINNNINSDDLMKISSNSKKKK